MIKFFIKKTLIFVILFLFFGAIITPNPSGEVSQNNDIQLTDTKIIDNTIISCEKNLNTLSEIDWWPMFRHDSRNSGCSSCIGPNTNSISWKENIPEVIYSATPIVYNDRLYIATGGFDFNNLKQSKITEKTLFETSDLIENLNEILTYKEEYDGGIYCLDANEGTALWNYPLYAPNDPLVVEDKVYITELDPIQNKSYLHCLDAINGYNIWKETLDVFVTTPTIGVDNKIFFCGLDFLTFEDSLKCYNTDGSYLWCYQLPENEIIMSVPICYDGKVHFITFDTYSYFQAKLCCVSAETGQFIWSHPIYLSDSIACVDDKVIIADLDIYTLGSNLRCFNSDTGALLWEYHFALLSYFGHPTVCNDSIYLCCNSLFSSSSFVHKLDLDGNFIWKIKIQDEYSNLIGSPVCSADKMFLCSTDDNSYTSKIFAFDAEDIIWSYTLDFESGGLISIADEKLYITDYNGNIYAFEDTLNIDNISGGILNVMAEVENTGSIDLNNISWEIDVVGGIFNGINLHAEGNISKLNTGETKTVKASPIFGLGAVDIDIMVSIPGLYPIKKNADGIVLGPFVIVKSG